ncbi:hypothetical protein JR316_0008634 [Psilocybe cubensis]|uniref:Uncharacterized protein n=2 Tax=Psilocybe cubensis TaxID=181762 RepID=A0ACB8GSH6_PSICU|nr:hypothetical protein JR316_0008634 [Psilocybe cubensis]KAH9478181.1 hypothetical protein JR316_0008634 [Psilocybe cubensis]
MDRQLSAAMALVPYQRVYIDTRKRIPHIFSLPVELMAIIFSLIAAPYLDDCGNMGNSNSYSLDRYALQLRTHPILVGVRHVCSYWFNLTSSMPSLWNIVLATPILSRPGERNYIKLHRFVSMTALYMRLGAPAALTVYLRPVNGMHIMRDDDENDDKWTISTQHRFYRIHQELYLELCTSHSTQIKSLTISFTRHMFWFFLDKLAHLDVVFSRLEMLDIEIPGGERSGDDTESIPELQFSRFFPALRNLKVINRRTPMDVCSLVQLSELHTLHLEQRGIVNQTVEVLRGLTSAKNVTLVERDFSLKKQNSSSDCSRVKLPCLEKLVLKCYPDPSVILTGITTPHLQILNVHSTGTLRQLYIAIRELIQVSECSLAALAVTHGKPDCFGLASVLEDFILSRIQTCRIKYEATWTLTEEERTDLENAKSYLSTHLDSMRRTISPSFVFESTGRFNLSYMTMWDGCSGIEKGVLDDT